MTTSGWVTAGLIGLGLACAPGTGPGEITLQGVVVRGPIAPVCISEHPCVAGFAARFDVYRRGRLEAHFNSCESGEFSLPLEPGDYEIVPEESAPVISPRNQRKAVRVDEPGPVLVTLEFDTGIR